MRKLSAAFFQREQYFASRTNYGQEYADAVMRYTPNWMFLILLAATLVCGIIGGFIGKSLLKNTLKEPVSHEQ